MLSVAAVGEALIGVALLASPTTVVRLLFGAEPTGVGLVVSRVAGVSLLALGVACWPGPGRRNDQAYAGMVIYLALTTIGFAYLGFAGLSVGTLLWPTTIVHGTMTALLLPAWLRKSIS
jgi:hypothetical protein